MSASTVNTERLLDSFCRYARVDTEAVDGAAGYPSSPGQLELGRMLLAELRAFGLADAVQDRYGIVTATVPAAAATSAPTIAFFAHLDTSPAASGKNVKPVVRRDYDGKDIVLPGDRTKVIRVAECPELAGRVGDTLVTTDGTTLLGADDKAGVAILMETAAHLLENPHVPHGPVKICFTCDEEVGHGVDHVDLKKLNASAGYTLDGGGRGEIDDETFSADAAVVTVTGVATHTGTAKGRMVNAVRLAAEFVARLPWQSMSPETTDDRQPFIHPNTIEGGIGSATVKILLRDFDTRGLAAQAKLLRQIAATLQAEYPRARIDVRTTRTYRNMAEGLAREPRAVAFADRRPR